MTVSDWVVVAGAAFAIIAVVIIGCCWDGKIYTSTRTVTTTRRSPLARVPDQEGEA